MINRPTKYKNKVYLFNLDEDSSKKRKNNLIKEEESANRKNRKNRREEEEKRSIENENLDDKLEKKEKDFLDEEIMRKLREMVAVFYPGLEVEVGRGASWEELRVRKRLNGEYVQVKTLKKVIIFIRGNNLFSIICILYG